MRSLWQHEEIHRNGPFNRRIGWPRLLGDWGGVRGSLGVPEWTARAEAVSTKPVWDEESGTYLYELCYSASLRGGDKGKWLESLTYVEMRREMAERKRATFAAAAVDAGIHDGTVRSWLSRDDDLRVTVEVIRSGASIPWDPAEVQGILDFWNHALAGELTYHHPEIYTPEDQVRLKVIAMWAHEKYVGQEPLTRPPWTRSVQR